MHAAQCTKLRVLTKVMYTVVYIDSFDHHFFNIKGLLQSEQLKQHVVIISMDKSLSNSDLYKHICFEKIKSYINHLENVMTNSIKRQLLKPSWYALLRDLLKTVQCRLDHLCL